MDEQERTCKTCCCFNAEANYCRCIDSSQAEWDTCPDHETHEEFDARMKAKREREIKAARTFSEKLWGEKPTTSYEETTRTSGFDYYQVDAIDAFHKKLKEHYAPYDDLLKAEPYIPMDIRSVLKKEGMPILIDEGWFNLLKRAHAEMGTIKHILKEIAEGKGRFDTDPQIHCSNTVEDMKALAIKALATLGVEA